MPFYINGKPQNGINNQPYRAMNIIEPKTNQPDSTRGELRVLQAADLRKMDNLPRKDYNDFLEATDMIIGACDVNLGRV